MRKKENSIFSGIVFCFILGTILFSFQSCNKYRASANLSDSLGISAEDFQPSWSPDGTRIVFASHMDDNVEIFIMNVDGSNRTKLTNSPARDMNPSWYPDGSKIIFDSNRNGNLDVYTMNIDGSDQTRLTDNQANDGMPSWSPDGARIAFYSTRDGNGEIYMMNADGSDLARLTDNLDADTSPSWSPDGIRIIFHSNRDGNGEIYTMNPDGSDQIRLTNEPGNDLHPSWSPDGTRIVFDSDRNGNREIYAMKPDGSSQIRLTDEPGSDGYPGWSPDSQKIVFSTDRDYDTEVYVMNADGSNPVNLTKNGPINESYGLAPLPKTELNLDEIPYRVVFESYRETEGQENWEICIVDANGSNLINLTDTPDIDERYPHASPDSRRICFVADEGENEERKRRNVYTMKIDGTDRVKIAENAYQPCWSGNGRYIAYLPGEFPRYNPDKRANKGIEIYDLETGEKKKHPNDKIIHIHNLCWSPDGEWFVASGSRDMPANECVFKADDKTMMRLTIVGCTPDISPDGKSLAWNSTDWSLNISALDFDSPQSNVTDHRMKVACERKYWVYHADWSPDGKYLAFTYGFDDEEKQESEKKPWSHICICDLKTGNWTQITTDGKYNEQPDWVPAQVR